MPSPFQLTEYAIRDLERTMDSLSQHSIAAAIRLSDRLEDAFRFLSQWPNSGRRSADFVDDPIRFWIVDDHVIAYLPKTSPLIVLAVTPCARDASPEIAFRLSKQ